MKRSIALVVGLALLAAACAGGRRLLPGQERQMSGGDPPAWVLAPVKEDTREAKAFCGVSRNLGSEGAARDDALRSAREQIIDAIGVQGEHVLVQVSSSLGPAGGILDPAVALDNTTKLVSEGQVRTRARQFHIERWQRLGESGLEYYHKAYVLVHWSNADAAEAVRQAVRAAAGPDAQVQANVDRALDRMKDLKAEDW
jgi:hypothetical protein